VFFLFAFTIIIILALFVALTLLSFFLLFVSLYLPPPVAGVFRTLHSSTDTLETLQRILLPLWCFLPLLLVVT
jgi:hypothetical protein